MKLGKKSKIAIPEKTRKKWGVCEHDFISYKELQNGQKLLYIAHRRVCKDNDRKGIILKHIVQDHTRLVKQWETKLLNTNNSYAKKLNELKASYDESINDWSNHYNRAIADLNEALAVNKNILKKNKDCIKKNKQILKSHNEITRAYNGLHHMGKFAQEQGIDIKEHQKQLPENELFEQKHTLMESGRVKHTYTFKKKKKGDDK
jgi:hypothetical protein